MDAHYAALKRAVEATIASRTTEEWQAILAAAGVPGKPRRAAARDPRRPAAGRERMFARQDHPSLGPVTVLGPPLRLDGDGFVAGRADAAFGSEARALLAWAGFSRTPT